MDPASDSVQGNFDPLKLSDAFRWISTAAVKYRQTVEAEKPVTVCVSAKDGQDATVEWSGLQKIDHDPFRSFMGSEEIRLALAAKIIEAHGGSAALADDRFIVQLPLSG
jgi:hypothetical protein